MEAFSGQEGLKVTRLNPERPSTLGNKLKVTGEKVGAGSLGDGHEAGRGMC